jgi:hypothetical protein
VLAADEGGDFAIAVSLKRLGGPFCWTGHPFELAIKTGVIVGAKLTTQI